MVISKEIKTGLKAAGYTFIIAFVFGLIYTNQDRWHDNIITTLKCFEVLVVLACVWLIIMGILSMFGEYL